MQVGRDMDGGCSRGGWEGAAEVSAPQPGAAIVRPMPLSAGSKLGPYELVSRLGAGGMGEVFAARDTRLDRSVAVKVLPAGLENDPDLQRRFEVEARAVGALNHPNVLAVFDVGKHEGV